MLIPRGPWQVEHRLIAFSSPGVRVVAPRRRILGAGDRDDARQGHPENGCAEVPHRFAPYAIRDVGAPVRGNCRAAMAPQKATQTSKNSVLLSLALRPLPS